MRIRDCPEQTQYIKKASDNRELDDVFAALDVLGSTAWAINRPIYDVISQVWNSGESIAGMPVKDPLLTIKDPPRPPNADEDIAVRTEYRRLLKEMEMHRRNQHGERCTTNYKLEIARAVSLVESDVFQRLMVRPSTLAKLSISLITWTFGAEHILSHHIYLISATTFLVACSISQRRNQSVYQVLSG